MAAPLLVTAAAACVGGGLRTQAARSAALQANVMQVTAAQPTQRLAETRG